MLLASFVGGFFGSVTVHYVMTKAKAPGHRVTARSLSEERKERTRYGTCSGCGAEQDEWCKEDCQYVDRFDWR